MQRGLHCCAANGKQRFNVPDSSNVTQHTDNGMKRTVLEADRTDGALTFTGDSGYTASAS